MFKDKNSELLFKLFLKEKNLTCNIETIHSTCICRIYINHIFGAKKCAHINFREKKYYVYGLPATNLEIFKYLNDYGHDLSFLIEDDNPIKTFVGLKYV